MLKSMTGFGKSQVNEAGYQITCEIKGVNHRYLDVSIRISRRYASLEERIKEEIKKSISRGRLEISINIDKTKETVRSIKVDKALAMAYHNSLKDLAENLNISADLRLIDLFRLPEVFDLENAEDDLEEVWQVLSKSLRGAILSMMEMKSREGMNLANDISRRNAYILSLTEKLEQRAPVVSREYRDKLRSRIKDLISAEAVDESRILQEAAIFADKASIAEEIVRLKSHIQQLNEFIKEADAVGRKCDFLVQEMFREINTVASKANDIEMSKIVVEAKAELEKIREQLQNVE